jgi:hypothetical protein
MWFVEPQSPVQASTTLLMRRFISSTGTTGASPLSFEQAGQNGNRLTSLGVVARVDGPLDAREKMRNLTGGSISIMCPAL